jgi:histidyl-tRNA synthetase
MNKKVLIQTPTGMHDILPENQKYYQKIFEIVSEIANFIISNELKPLFWKKPNFLQKVLD